MNKLFAILALVLCLPFAGCVDESGWNPPDIGQSLIAVSPSGETSVRIASGSGNYSASIDDESIAEVSVVLNYGTLPELVIEPLKEGDAEITVTDKTSGLKAILVLKVAKYTTTFKIAEIEFSVVADNPEVIETDLEADASIPPVGGSILLSTWNSPPEWALAGADGGKFAHGTLKRDELTAFNPIFRPLMPDVRRYAEEKWIFLDEKEEVLREFDMCIIAQPATRLNMPSLRADQFRFYEDLTEYYQAKFPDAGVKSVARVLISNGIN